jgi:FkbM family methyltransferase
MFETNYVLFDVGANWGDDSLPVCARDPNMIAWAFEPTPHIANHLKNASRNFSDRYTVVESAIEEFDGEAEFFIQNNPGMGCNSLNQFDKEAIEKYWLSAEGVPRIDELSAVGSITVAVSRLDTWIKDNLPDLDHIDFFHCDTQGSDLKVLKGMGDYISLIRTGKIECARDQEIKLYKESTNFVDDVCEYLESKGFTITEIESNDHMGNELNVYFEKK